ncbi:MAG: RluA family pseudouridine synthase [Phycisphaerales bacterium]|nr:RluA family pseudouridine synthase [Phycisphaerales bacterium]
MTDGDRNDVAAARERLLGVRVLRRGTGWLALEKPSGVLSVPGKGDAGAMNAVSWVIEHAPLATGPITVHRLDMDTSGILLVALDAERQRLLSMQFEARSVEKQYVAIVDGLVAADSGTFDAPMRLDVPNRPRQIVDPVQGKVAVTRYRVIERSGGRTRLELTPLTGRTHQLRLHCAHAGHPILGDPLYGGAGVSGAARLLLHATRLAFDDPSLGERVVVESPAPF